MPRYDDHLLPEASVYTDIRTLTGDKYSSVYADYEENVARVLIDAFNDSVVARVVVLPSFEPEYAVGLTLQDGNYAILVLEASTQLVNFEHLEMMRAGAYRQADDLDGSKQAAEIKDIESQLPASRKDVAVKRCERKVSERVGAKLYTLWSEMLFRTRYPDLRPANADAPPAPLGLHIDGTAYHFSFEYPGFTLAGKIHSPTEESITGRFVAITRLMKDACHAEDNEGLIVDLEHHVDELTARLSKTVY